MTARDSTVGWGEWPAWLDDATETPACRGHDLALFFPEQKAGQRMVRQATAICDVCPLKPTCKAWALAQPPHQLYGVWGGTTTNQRRMLAQRGTQPAQFRKTPHTPKGTT